MESAPLKIDLANPDPEALRSLVEDLNRDPERKARWQIQSRQQRDERTGQFVPLADGEQGAAATHGLRSRKVTPELLALQEAFLASSLVDEGEREENIPTRRRSLLQYRAVLHRSILQLDLAFRERGLFSRDTKLRVAWLTQLTGLIARAEAIDKTLGLERRQKQLPVPSAREWVTGASTETESETEEAATCERG